MAKKVFIDPGHGGNDSGAVGSNNLYEKNINLQVAKKVESLLKKQDIEVKLSRTDDKTLSLGDRTKMANAWKPDCFISIHCNAANKTAKGIETFSTSAATSNLASCVHSEVLNTKAYTLNRGLKTANFYVIKNTTMRACLIELAFIDNTEDAKILLEKQNELALGIAKGICKYLGVAYKPESTTPQVNEPVKDSEIFYRVICGSFNNKVYAEEKIEELKALGITEAFIAAYKKE